MSIPTTVENQAPTTNASMVAAPSAQTDAGSKAQQVYMTYMSLHWERDFQ